MKILKIFGLITFILSCISCNTNDGGSTIEEEQQQLNQMFTQIETLATSVNCTDASEWRYTNYGSKPCGGPVGFIAYSTTIDTASFLAQIEAHRNAQEAFNIKWELSSDCSTPTEPTGVKCENGGAVLEYDY